GDRLLRARHGARRARERLPRHGSHRRHPRGRSATRRRRPCAGGDDPSGGPDPRARGARGRGRAAVKSDSEALLTDLYELTMLDGYFAGGLRETAAFELFVRKLPPGRHFMVAAGLEQALSFLERLRFSEEEIASLEGATDFSWAFLDKLSQLRFTGDVDAVP